jgi:GNAT superfamily N-acetyltransferase
VNFLLEKCLFLPLGEVISDGCFQFDCDNQDLNDFFTNDAVNYSKELLGKSHCFVLEEDRRVIVCAFTVSNDSINVDHMPGSRKKKVIKDIPRAKHMKRYPAVLIGRLGVNKEYHNAKIGTDLMNFIKSWFVDENNKTGCRYIVVDSYNENRARSFYQKNGFNYIFSEEEQEIKHTRACLDKPLPTRLMYFDLIQLKDR